MSEHFSDQSEFHKNLLGVSRFYGGNRFNGKAAASPRSFGSVLHIPHTTFLTNDI